MRKEVFIVGIFLVFFVGCSAAQVSPVKKQDTVRIACLGDSITIGNEKLDPATESYPALLNNMLPDTMEVGNFGVSGATLLKKGGRPYMKENTFKKVLEYNPHIAIIFLGINDTQPDSWVYHKEFVSDYKSMIYELKALPTKPKIIVCYPTAALSRRFGHMSGKVKDAVIPYINEVATEVDIHIVDLYSQFLNRKDLYHDAVHLNKKGLELVAQIMFYVLTGEKWEL